MADQINKILIDNNLSVKLQEVLADVFPGSMHVADLYLTDAVDSQLWKLAQEQEYAIMTKDKDFYHRVSVSGAPPAIIWITRGNCSNREMLELVEKHIPMVRSFLASSQDLLIIS